MAEAADSIAALSREAFVEQFRRVNSTPLRIWMAVVFWD